jgi:hypothetical protein
LLARFDPQMRAYDLRPQMRCPHDAVDIAGGVDVLLDLGVDVRALYVEGEGYYVAVPPLSGFPAKSNSRTPWRVGSQLAMRRQVPPR